MALSNNTTLAVKYHLTHKYGIDVTSIDPKLSYEINKELVINNSYVKITEIEGNKDIITMSVTIYLDSSKSEIVDIKHYGFSLKTDNPSDNFIKQGYEYLKTLPDFYSAVDVLEEGQML